MGYTQAVSLTSSGAEASLLAGPDCLRCVGGDQRQAVGVVRVPVLSFEAGLSSEEAFIDRCAARSRFHDAIARRSVFRVRICAAHCVLSRPANRIRARRRRQHRHFHADNFFNRQKASPITPAGDSRSVWAQWRRRARAWAVQRLPSFPGKTRQGRPRAWRW